ncbi:unnamed protein product [Rotaria socialis]|uniref:ARID domain-containing protein n=1 Tax=Rotaria socialis TaxID=392032 RepID=A0A817ZBW1_9BILA|nr:unnamed protein product [Rotaria socialis]CAF4330856.1 unnamed protein product [Rotaria socialis]
MTTYAPIQPRPILSKPLTANSVQSSSIFLVPSSTLTNTNFYQTNTDFNVNNASQISSLPSTSLSPYEEFLKRLREFHRGRQTPLRSLPTIAGQIVDLHLLYNTVVGHGGWDKVNDRHLWSTVASQFSIDESCLNGTQALKNIYIRYLYAFEKISNGENIDSRDDENEDSKRRTVSHLQRVPQSYNVTQHIVSDALRIQNGLFNDFVHRNEYEKLELALLCGFPNELTFTLNTLLLLSSSSNHTKSFHLYKCPRVLDLLFRHIGLFLPSDTLIQDHYLKTLYEDLWSKHLNYHMGSFWIESCSPKILKLLLNIDIDNQKANPYQNFNFNSTENQREQEFRIEQILMIIRNLSFDRLNALYLLDTIQSTVSITYIFLLLISYCDSKIELQKYAHDIWTNLAIYMHLRTISSDEGLLFRQLLNSMLNGDDDQQQQEDRLKIIRALEIITNLARAGNDNGIYLVDYIDTIVKSLIHIPDILILVHCLECLYQLSESGEQLCDAILKVQSSTSIITTLIDLLTIEARSFSSDTIKTIKLIEMSSGPALLPSYHQPPIAPQSIVVLSSNQAQQQAQHHQIYPIENYDMNKNNARILIQQNSKPITLSGLLSSGNILSVAATTSTQNPSVIMPKNTNIHINDKKRKYDCITESMTTSINDILSSSKISRPASILSKPPTNEVSSCDEVNHTANSIQLTMTDILDHCSSLSYDSDIVLCLNDLCQRVVSMVDPLASDVSNPMLSPRFKRKIETSITKEISHIDEQLQIKSSDQITKQKSSIDNLSCGIIVTEKKGEPIEKELSDGKLQISTSNVITTTATSDYFCDWDNCRASFATARAVFHHTCSVHVKHSSDYVCLWNGCDRLKRQKWALINHIQERHCSEVAFRQAKLKLTNPALSTTVNTSTTSSTIINNSNRILTSGSVGYTSDAAWFAIRRYMQANSFDDQLNKNKEGPLTKSIRLTAALILRNIARHSSIGKQNLRQYEQILANLALESSEASHTLSSCLFELCN